jgi:histidinol-phosphate aminotransferase
VIPWNEIKAILNAAAKVGAVVFLDEAYSEYASESHLDKVQHITNLVIGKTFSKIYGLAGLRIGWAVIPENLLGEYRKVQTPFNTNKIGLLAAKAALTDQEFVQYSKEKNTANMQMFHAGLQKLEIKTFSSAGNFLSFEASNKFLGSAEKLCANLRQKGIILRNASKFYGAPLNLVRATIGKEAEIEKILLELI